MRQNEPTGVWGGEYHEQALCSPGTTLVSCPHNITGV